MLDNTRFISEKEVSRIIGRALSTLRNDRYEGKGIPYTKLGRSVRYQLADVFSFMRARRIETEKL